MSENGVFCSISELFNAVGKINELLRLKKFCTLKTGNLRKKKSSNRNCPQREDASGNLLP